MMDLGSLLFLVGVALLFGLMVSSPLFTQKNDGKKLISSDEDRHKQLALAKLYIEELEDSLDDLDVDRVSNKIFEDDYQHRKGEMENEMRVLYAEAERIEAVLNFTIDEEKDQKDAPLYKEKELEELISTYRRTRDVKAVGLCSNCGQAFLRGDCYCSKCGSKIQTEKYS